MKKILILIGFILPIQIFGQVWVARYNGSVGDPGDYDAAYAMTIDDSGYIYVTGTGGGDTAEPNYMTIKYNGSGDTVWVRRYNGPDKYSDDDAYAIAVDKNGNVYVTGRSTGIGTYYDYATVKYNSLGDEMWVRRYNYSSSTWNGDYAYAIAVDDSGNVYVTGRSDDSSTGSDYATIKYNSLGNTMWVRRYNGPAGNKIDEASAMAIDNNGNIYVTGKSRTSTSYEYTTIKYNGSGDTLWVRRYGKPGYVDNEANAIAVDDSGNVYITGISSSSVYLDSLSKYMTIKYNSAGDTVWGRTYSVMVKKSYDETKISSTYKEMLTTTLSRVKGNKNIYGQRGATALAIDSDGNVYVTGKSYSSATNYDYATIKYNSSGDTMWARRYNGTGDSIDVARGIVVDNDGNVYVTGNSWGVGSAYGEDYATIKYSSSGSEEWVQRYNGPANMVDNAYSIAVDNKGYVYVTGGSEDYNYDYTTIKYSTVGIEEPLTLDFGLGIWELKAFPNPFVKNTELRVKGSALKDNKIQIYDLGGRLVKTTHSNIIGNDLKKGIYFVKVNNYKPIKVVKMSYVK